MQPIIFKPNLIGRMNSDLSNELLDALDHIFLSVVKLELDSGNALLLQSFGQKENVGYTFKWEQFLDFYRSLVLPEEVEKLSSALYIDRLRELREAGRTHFRLNLACRPQTALEWLELTVHLPADTNNAFILMRQSNDNYLLHRIIEMYVYSNCDCFYFLDVEKNCCTMFNGKPDTPLPPPVCTDYSSEIIDYAKTYVVPEDRKLVIHEMSLSRVLQVLQKQEIHSFTFGMLDKNGRYTRKQMEYRYYDRKKNSILLTRTDVTDLYEEHMRHTQELQEALNQARHDPLTQLLNYTGVRTAIEQDLEAHSEMAALLFLDLDNFKRINDSQGHITGNRVLQKVADILNDNIGPEDYAARIGGDEFVVFLRTIQSPKDAECCAERICSRIAQLTFGGLPVSCSIGVSIAPTEGTTATALIKVADEKLYRAKSFGKNQFAL